MKYEIDFDNIMVEDYCENIRFNYEWSEANYKDGEFNQNGCNIMAFKYQLKSLKLFGAEIEIHTDRYIELQRINFARINSHVFIKNNVMNRKELYDALWEIAHQETKKEAEL